jgi:predicted glycoside hydrolase/deacetylase ChbG (UPF0249 family)
MQKIPSKKIIAFIYLILFILIIYFLVNGDGEIRLIVRGDDMGFSRYANAGCIKAYQEGILTAVEVMVPCDYFQEAVELLNQNPGLDVGIHLTLNSEWENIKWGPITKVPSLVDENGYFFPMTWPDDAYAPEQALGTANWQLDEIENELRAQIERMLHYLPECSHATPHMGFHSISPEIYNVTFNLVKEYNIDANIRMLPLEMIWLFGDSFDWQEMATHAVSVLEDLEPGTYETYDHPGMIIEGEELAWHIGAENDGLYRAAVTKALTDKRLKEVIDRRGIQLIGYRDLQFWH